MHELLCTSPAVSPNNVFGTREGFGLPEVIEISDYTRLWDESNEQDWPAIRKVWEAYWQKSRPILLEKTPSNLIHGAQITRHFDPAYFIIMVRNLYAHIESFLRRDQKSLAEAVQSVTHSLRWQRTNLEILSNVLLIRYEELTDRTETTADRLIAFLPSIQSLDIHRAFSAHNSLHQKLPISNLNQQKIARLSSRQMEEINTYLQADLDILSYFGYSILD